MKKFIAILTIVCVLGAIFAASILYAPARPGTAHAASSTAQKAVEHIKFSPSVVDNAPSFTVTLSGSHFPVDDSEVIDVTTDATFGSSPACESVTFLQTPVTDSNGNFAVRVQFSGCFGNNNIVATAVDDHHLNHAVLHIK